MYSRKIDGQTLTLAPSGWTYKNTFVLYDKETGSLWYPYRKGLKSIQGKFLNQWLPVLKSKDTKWGKWEKQYPDSKVLE